MTKKRLNIVRIVLAVIMITAAVCGFAACGGSKAKGISVGRNDMPRLTYVEGQDLDFSSGKITIEYEGSTETVAMNSEKVSVSGYDNAKTGKQKITLSYEGLTTQIEVTVIARIRTENAQKVYYVGEPFDNTKGKLVVANDDATTFDVPFTDSSVSFKGFDSSAAAEALTVTAVYESGEKHYEGTFEVSVYEADDAKLNAPRKLNYSSHETLSLSGAYITLKHGGADEKQVAVTEDMITGIDFSLVTEENSPMQQTATVTYCGKKFEFTVTVTYSKVSAVKKLLEEGDFKWSEPDVPETDDETGARAVECMEAYLDLTAGERDYLKGETLEAAARTAIAYSYNKWEKAFEELKDTVTIRSGSLLYVLSSYEKAVSDNLIISDENAAVNAGVNFLSSMEIVFEDLTIGGVKTEEYIKSVTLYNDNKTEISEGISFVTKLYDTLKNVPSNASDLKAYEKDITAAKDLILGGDFEAAANRDLLTMVSVWREKDDFYDIIYSYYYDKEDAETVEQLAKIVLPSKLNEVRALLVEAITQYSAIINESEGGGYVTDSTYLVYYFRLAKEAKEEALSDARDYYADLYYAATFNDVLVDAEGNPLEASFSDLFSFVAIRGYGYYDLVGGTLDDEKVSALWDSYLKIAFDTAESEIEGAMKKFVEDFANLSPAEQQSFILSVNVYYDGYEKPAFDMETGYTMLTRMLQIYYGEELSDEEFTRLQNLLFAIESYSQVGYSETAVTEFLKYFALVQEGYNDFDNETFRGIFGAVYQRYSEIADLYGADGTLVEDYEVPEEWQKTFDELVDLINDISEEISVIMPEDDKDAENSFIRLYASYERIMELYDKIMTEAPESVKEAYYRVPVKFSEQVSLTLDYAVEAQAMRIGVFCYAQINFGGTELWEIVKSDSSLRSFFAACEKIVKTDSSSETVISAEEAAEVMKKFIALSYRDRLLVTQLQEIHGEAETEYNRYYYDGLKTIFSKAFGKDSALKAAADALLDAEYAFTEYLGMTKYVGAENADKEELAAATEAAKTAYANLEQAISALSSAEKISFEGLFGEILSYYRTEANELNA